MLVALYFAFVFSVLSCFCPFFLVRFCVFQACACVFLGVYFVLRFSSLPPPCFFALFFFSALCFSSRSTQVMVAFLECTYCLPALYHVPCNACIHICSYIYCFPTHTDVGQSLLLMCMRRIVNMLLACVRALVIRLLACVRACNGGHDSNVCACV